MESTASDDSGRDQPLILTLALDKVSFARFDAERRSYFPPRINHIPAHVTLFHHLPGAAEPEISLTLRTVCAAHQEAPVRVTALFSLGRGVAYRLDAPDMTVLREDLARRWAAWLTPQDRQPWRPHVTVQNKVSPPEARETLTHLQSVFTPFEAVAEGLLLWRYLDGPWEPLGLFPFAGAS